MAWTTEYDVAAVKDRRLPPDMLDRRQEGHHSGGTYRPQRRRVQKRIEGPGEIISVDMSPFPSLGMSTFVHRF